MDENIFYPELTLETDDIIMELTIKKDYSKCRYNLFKPNIVIILSR